MSNKPDFKMKDLTKMTVAQLKSELASRGLDLTGKKADLHLRLKNFMKANGEPEDDKLDESQDEKKGEENGKEEKAVEEAEEEAAEEEAEEGEEKEEEMEEEIEEELEEGEEDVHEEHEEEEHEEEPEEGEVEHLDEEHEEEEEGEAQDENAEYVMIDEADGDDEIEETIINEEELLREEEDEDVKDMEDIEIEIKTNDDSMFENKAKESKLSGKREVKVKPETKGSTVAVKKEGAKKLIKKTEQKVEKKEEEKDDDVEPLPEEEIIKLEEKHKAESHENYVKSNRGYLLKAPPKYIHKLLDQARNQLSVLVTPFQHDDLDKSIIRDSIKAALEVNIRSKPANEEESDEEKNGFLELCFPDIKTGEEYKRKLAAELTECEVSNVDHEFLSKHSRDASERLHGPYKFQDKYADCLLVAEVQVPEKEDEKEEEEEGSKEDAVADELRDSFPGARTVVVHKGREPTDVRHLLVEYSSPSKCKEALEQLKDKDITFYGEKAKFALYKDKSDEKLIEVRLKSEQIRHRITEKQFLRYNTQGGLYKNSFKNVKIPSEAPMDDEKRKELYDRLHSTLKASNLLWKKKERTEAEVNRLKIILKEKNRIVDELYYDDYQRKRLGKSRIQWKCGNDGSMVPRKSSTSSTRGARGSVRGTYRGRGQIRGRGRGTSSTGLKRQYSQTSVGSSASGRPAKLPRYSDPNSSLDRSSSYRSSTDRTVRGRGSYRGSSRGSYQGSRGRGTGRGASRYTDSRGDDRGTYAPSRSSSGPRRVQGSGGGDIRVKVGHDQRGYGYQDQGQSRGYFGGNSRYEGNRYQSSPQRGDYQQRSPRQQPPSQHMGGGGEGGASNQANPVQLLLGLSKVLSNQIKQIQEDGPVSKPSSDSPRYSRSDSGNYNQPRGRSSGGYAGGSGAGGYSGGRGGYSGGGNYSGNRGNYY